MERKVSKRQIAFALVAVCLVGLIGIGISYSYYLANISTSNTENKNSDISSATITKVVMDMQGKVSSDGAYPGHKVVKEVIVRGIGEENSLPANASIQITPDLGDFKDDVTWKLYKSEEVITCSSTVHEDGEQYYEETNCTIPDSASLELEGGSESAYKNIVVNPNTETKYYLVVEYANKENEDQSDQMGKSFNIDIGIGEKQLEGLDKIIASVDTTGKCPTINDDGTVNVTSVEATDGYLCSAEDAYGTSYYYRGNVTNNYVKFADKYWRIIRINGDGTVRVIYDGTEAHANGESSTDRQIGTSMFNSNYDDNMYVGYMYGEKNGPVEDTSQYGTTSWTNTSSYYVAKEYTFNESSKSFTLKDPVAILTTDLTTDYIGYYTANSWSIPSSYDRIYRITAITAGDTNATIGYERIYYGTSSKEVAQTNKNSSTIKTYLDNWYKTNILGTGNEQYLTDNIFCNDRSIRSGDGYGENSTDYHWDSFYSSAYNSNLKCTQQNDAFTVSDTMYGNGALTYPIGLISTDEVVLAGGWNVANSSYYLYSGSWYWAFSPYNFYGYGASVRDVDSGGNARDYYYVNNSNGGVRPVLNLSPEALQNGDGSISNPFHP